MRWTWPVFFLLAVGPGSAQQLQASDELAVRFENRIVIHATRTPFTLPGLPLFHPYAFDKLREAVEQSVLQQPRNALIGANGQIVPEQLGKKLDRAAFEDRFSSYFYGSGPLTIEAPVKPLYPKVDSELLAFIREKPIGQYVTYFNARNKNRTHNIALASKAIDSQVVFPFEKFSFNQAVGIRNTAKGYLRAPIIVRGELAEDIGGGICQVSSTLFNAVDRAGLRIVQRYSHSRHVRYVLPGRDATVSWGGADFVFQNQYNQPVLVRTFVGAGRIVVSLYSSEAIEYHPKEVPSTSKKIPEEVSVATKGKPHSAE